MEVIQKVVPEQGFVQRRYDEQGDEILVILPSHNERMALSVAERLRVAIKEHSFSSVGPGVITSTIGLATYPETFEDLDRLFDEADLVVGRPKHKDRNLRDSVHTCKELLDDRVGSG